MVVQQHHEDYGHTWHHGFGSWQLYLLRYRLDCSILYPGCPFLFGCLVSGGETYTWYTSKRLQHFKDRLHGAIKEDLGASYESLFKDTPFIQHGLPGTTRKLHCWCTSLTRAVNEESFSKPLLVLVLSFLDTPRYS